MLENLIYEYQEITNKDLTFHIENTPSLHKYFKDDKMIKLKMRSIDLDCGLACGFNEYIIEMKKRVDKL